MDKIAAIVALLSTGDELVNGDVLNTNSYVLAQQLFDHFIQPGQHLTASDNQEQIEEAMKFLLAGHEALIITGGLGPTSDDRTRFALSEVIQTDLVFDEACWQRVVARLQRFSLPVPETNRQQCLFPRNAVIFPNENGTAAACMTFWGEKPVFLLPGPPFECLPIFNEHVLPYLQKQGFARPLFRREWLLLGVSEGSIAEQLDPLAENSSCYVGYCLNHPYLEVKLKSEQLDKLEMMQRKFEVIIGKYSVSTHKQKASTQLIEWALKERLHLYINDQATGGALQTTLLSPMTFSLLHFKFASSDKEAVNIELSGLESYWENKQQITNLQIIIQCGDRRDSITLNIPYRKERTLLFAVEMASWEILKIVSHY